MREAMHSAFLYHAIQAGLDMAIVNAGALPVYDDVPADLLEAVEDVLFNRRPDATERLTALAGQYTGATQKQVVSNQEWRSGPVEDRLQLRARTRDHETTSWTIPRRREASGLGRSK